MDRIIRKQLERIVGADNLTTEREDLLCYSYDGTGLEYLPSAVLFPGTTAEVSALMEVASAHRLPVLPRGAGSGMSGGSLPVAGGLVLAMNRFDRIIEVDTDNQTAVVEPGVVTGRFQEAVKRKGLFYPPDPASLDFCTLGGNVAECAGGPSAVKYGVTRDYVLGLETVLSDGGVLHTGVRTAKGVVGYDLTRLFVGSEGTLGVITRIVLRLLPLPQGRRTFLVHFDSLARAVGLVSELLGGGILPATLEYMDRTALEVVADFLPGSLPAGTRALLLIELDGDDDVLGIQERKLLAFLPGRPGIIDSRRARNRREAEELRRARRSVSPAAFTLKPHKISEDVVVPRSRIPELVTCAEDLAEKYGLPILTFGHAGDGNIHVNIMLDRQDPAERRRGEQARKSLFETVVRLSGTMSGEHGVGLTKLPFLHLELDETSIRLMRRVKQAFDPLNILNPGKILPPGGTEL